MQQDTRQESARKRPRALAGLVALSLLVLVGARIGCAGFPESAQWREEGRVSWYGPGFDGRRTASGEIFDPAGLTMAHPELPFGSRVRVTNLNNGRSVIVRVNDRGPFAGNRIGDLSPAAAAKIGMKDQGVAMARLDLLDRGPESGDTARPFRW